MCYAFQLVTCFLPDFLYEKPHRHRRLLRVVYCRRDSKTRRENRPPRRGWSATPDSTGGNVLKFIFRVKFMFISNAIWGFIGRNGNQPGNWPPCAPGLCSGGKPPSSPACRKAKPLGPSVVHGADGFAELPGDLSFFDENLRCFQRLTCRAC